ncbi:hypothetical protein NEHOM01_0057 [Nematocida homosporus]|uniref:uncharacterized protein n=1 Tax=Nematocida homosporus TaxID=1912981 RepID=UPI00221F491E|nr:uncharacterized protein NEHOM01_0057 [Nematocida homosporus]KAI5184312.1 hypothetical protein NEHOM01_0057 [Nematocida homosporus]
MNVQLNLLKPARPTTIYTNSTPTNSTPTNSIHSYLKKFKLGISKSEINMARIKQQTVLLTLAHLTMSRSVQFSSEQYKPRQCKEIEMYWVSEPPYIENVLANQFVPVRKGLGWGGLCAAKRSLSIVQATNRITT